MEGRTLELLHIRKLIKFLFLKCKFKHEFSYVRPSTEQCILLILGQRGAFLLDGDMASSSGHSERKGGICLWKPASFCSAIGAGWILSLCPGLGGEHENHGKVSCSGWAGSSPAAPAAPSKLEAGQGFPAPLATFSSEDFPDFQLQGRRLQSLVTRPKWAIFHVDGKKHSWNKSPSPPDKLKFLL